MKLHAVTQGSGPKLLIAHGLFGSARNWGVLAKRLSDTCEVTVVDMRNHGASPWADSHTYADMAADLAEVIPEGAHVLGHSMGGKAAMVLALEYPHLVKSLLVTDIAPVGYGHSQAHLIEAMRALPLPVANRAEAREKLDVPEEVRDFLLQSLDVAGGRWRLNLDVLERYMPEIIGFPEVSGHYDGPALFLSGALSDYVRPEHRDRIRALFPAARFARIPGAGHWLHADRPREFEAAVRGWLAHVTGV